MLKIETEEDLNKMLQKLKDFQEIAVDLEVRKFSV